MGTRLRAGNSYRMRIWNGESAPAPDDDGEVIDFIGYFTKEGKAAGPFKMRDLKGGNIVCRVNYRGHVTDIIGDVGVWWTNPDMSSRRNRVSFLTMPVSA